MSLSAPHAAVLADYTAAQTGSERVPRLSLPYPNPAGGHCVRAPAANVEGNCLQRSSLGRGPLRMLAIGGGRA